MDAKQLADLLTEITKQCATDFKFENKSSDQSRQEQLYDPKTALRTALMFVNGNTQELLIDIVEIITLFLLRGPKISKLSDKTKEFGKKRIDILKKKYHLKDFASAEEVASGKALSLKKLIPAFPYQLLIVMKNEKYERPLGKGVLNDAEASRFPEFLKSTSFLSVIPFPRNICRNNIWPTGEEGIKKFKIIVQGVIAYEYLESFVLHKWGNDTVPLPPAKALWNVISVAQNILNSDFINQQMREDNFGSMFENDLNQNFGAIKNLIHYTDKKYPGFIEILDSHFNYDVKIMKFACKAKIFCRHVER